MVLLDQSPARTHELASLAQQLDEALPAELLALQVYAVEARYEEGPFALMASRQELMAALEQRFSRVERDLER